MATGNKTSTTKQASTNKKPLGADKLNPLEVKSTEVLNEEQAPKKKVTTIGADSKSKRLKNFRLRTIDIERLTELTKQVNLVCEYENIKEVDIIQALLYLGTKEQAVKVLRAYKDSI